MTMPWKKYPSCGKKHTSKRRSLALGTLLFLLVLTLQSTALAMASPQNIGPEANDRVGSSMLLYLEGTSALSPMVPSGDADDYASFRPGAGINAVDVGVWKSRPLEADLEIGGKIQVSLWARGTGIQTSCTFMVSYGVDDEYLGMYHTQETALTGNPIEFLGEDMTSFNISKGQALSLKVSAHERGTGGEIVFGSTSHPSYVAFDAEPVSTSTYSQEHRAGMSIRVTTTVMDVWGLEDISHVDQFIAGPYDRRQLDMDGNEIPQDKIIARAAPMDQAVTGVATATMNVSWLWIYDGWKWAGEDVEPGIYYLVGKVHTNGGGVYTDVGTVVIPERDPGVLGGAGGTIMVAVLIGGLAVGAYFLALRSERIYTPRGRTLAAVLMVSIIVAAGMYVFVTAVPINASSGGEAVADFTLTTIDGSTFTLSHHRGKVVYLDLFATWCPSCNAQMPTLVKLHQRYQNAIFISVSVEGSGDSEAELRTFKEKYGADWDFALDTDRVWQRYQDLSQPFIPTSVIINPEGKMTFRSIGESHFKDLVEQMDKASGGGFDVTLSTHNSGLEVIAFITGVLSFFAPCAFPLLPGYLGFVLTRKNHGKKQRGKVELRRHILGGIASAAGIIAIFSLAGILVAAAGSAVMGFVNYLAPAMAIVIAIIGLLMLLDKTSWTEGVINAISPMTSKVQGSIGRFGSKRNDDVGLFLYGAGYGIASMGCQAPVFVAIIMAGFVAGGFENALLLFIMFGLGMGLMMVMVTVLVGMAKGVALKRMTSAMPTIRRASGAILLIAGIYLAWYYFSILSLA